VGEQTGLYQLANNVAKKGRSVACAAGVSDWTALANPAAVRLVPALEPHVEQFEAAVEAYIGTLGPSNRPALDPAPAAFASDMLGLRWDWLPYELLNAGDPVSMAAARYLSERFVRDRGDGCCPRILLDRDDHRVEVYAWGNPRLP
jgi:hypothetical protein